MTELKSVDEALDSLKRIRKDTYGDQYLIVTCAYYLGVILANIYEKE